MDQCINKILHIETDGGIFDGYYYVAEKIPKDKKMCILNWKY